MEILFQCKDYVVCIKPAGVISESNGNDGLPDLLKEELNCEVYTVHRLDKNVTGVMVYALNSKTAANLSAQIQNGGFHKQYTAIVHGTVSPENGEMTDLLFKDKQKSKAYIVKRERKGVRKAKLEYRTLKHIEYLGQPAAVVEVDLHTGRYHQIRVQFASRGYPIFGDRRYGAKDESHDIMLFSTKLEFLYPKNNQTVVYRYLPEKVFNNL